MSSECKGCLSYSEDLINGCRVNIYPHLSEAEHCPCLICLVKGMCKTECIDFKMYKRAIWASG